MTDFHISISWIDAAGDVLPDAPAGCNVADFFEDRAAWMGDEYTCGQDVFDAAEAAYRGPDLDGIGIQVTIWDERRGHISQPLAAHPAAA